MTYWNNDGKHQQKYEDLWKLVPEFGRSSEANVDRVRLVSNLYFDYYNNGWDRGVVNERRVTDFLENEEIKKLVIESGNADAIATYTRIADGWDKYQNEDDEDDYDRVFKIEGVGEPDFELGLEALFDLILESA